MFKTWHFSPGYVDMLQCTGLFCPFSRLRFKHICTCCSNIMILSIILYLYRLYVEQLYGSLISFRSKSMQKNKKHKKCGDHSELNHWKPFCYRVSFSKRPSIFFFEYLQVFNFMSPIVLTFTWKSTWIHNQATNPFVHIDKYASHFRLSAQRPTLAHEWPIDRVRFLSVLKLQTI